MKVNMAAVFKALKRLGKAQSDPKAAAVALRYVVKKQRPPSIKSSKRKRKPKLPSTGKQLAYRVIPFGLTPLARQLASDPSVSLYDCGVRFRCVKINPVKQLCPSCKQVNYIDAISCSRCHQALEELV